MSLDFLQLLGLKAPSAGARYLRGGEQEIKKGGDGGPAPKISPQCLQPAIFSLPPLKR